MLAGLAGVVAGLALGLMPRTERVLNPYLDAANAMPRIALAPLLIVALGIGTTAKVALASTLVFFIVLSGARLASGPPTPSGSGCRRSSAPGNASCSSR